ncbi:MAG: ATP-dependent DNA helicase RecQ [Bacteroidia bacterium]
MDIHQILKKYWGYDAFRPLQADIIESVIAGHDTLALLPTGGGKSLCFQVPALYFDGMTIVISPLVALMKDQVERLNSLGITATYLHSGLSQFIVEKRLQAAMDGKFKFLYIAPERIHSELFIQRLPKMKVSLLVADEAHCISQWGYDFRPSYLDIHLIREVKPEIPLIAVTASATPDVQLDIIRQLQLSQVKHFAQSFSRKNLRYFVIKEQNVAQRILQIVQKTNGTGIVYARTRRHCERMATLLQHHGISAIAYHGGMTHSQRDQIQTSWIRNEHRVIVATNAFGMGIDKPDVRFVLHYELPADLESYYQEAGRGGRDGKTALAIAFQNPIDIAEVKTWNTEKYPTWDRMEEVFWQICNYFHIPNEGSIDVTHTLKVAEWAKEWKIPLRQLYNSLQLLHKEGFIYLKEEVEDYGYIQMVATPKEVLAYKQQYPKMALLLEMILRNMGGAVYSQEVAFLPQVWASALGWAVEELDEQLMRLVQLELISYQSAAGEPSLRILKPKNALSKNAINWQKYTFLQQQAATRLEKMLQYIESETQCRSQMISEYFGEQQAEACGKCDICVGRNRAEVNHSEFDKIQKSVISQLKESEMSYRTLLQTGKEGSYAQKEEVLRYLLEQKTIVADITGNLKLNVKG